MAWSDVKRVSLVDASGVDVSSLPTVQNVSSGVGGVATSAIIFAAAANVNSTIAKATPGRAFRLSGINKAAYDIFFKMYNKATAPAVGTDPIVAIRALPAGQAFDLELGAASSGLYFSVGIVFAVTKLVAASDTTVLAANDFLALNLEYA